MSKKKKFKKISRTQILENIDKTDNTGVHEKAEITEVKKTVSKINNSEDIGLNSPEIAYAVKDLQRIAITFSVILLLLVGANYINLKTDIFNNLSDGIVKVLNLE